MFLANIASTAAAAGLSTETTFKQAIKQLTLAVNVCRSNSTNVSWGPICSPLKNMPNSKRLAHFLELVGIRDQVDDAPSDTLSEAASKTSSGESKSNQSNPELQLTVLDKKIKDAETESSQSLLLFENLRTRLEGSFNVLTDHHNTTHANQAEILNVMQELMNIQRSGGSGGGGSGGGTHAVQPDPSLPSPLEGLAVVVVEEEVEEENVAAEKKEEEEKEEEEEEEEKEESGGTHAVQLDPSLSSPLEGLAEVVVEVEVEEENVAAEKKEEEEKEEEEEEEEEKDEEEKEEVNKSKEEAAAPVAPVAPAAPAAPAASAAPGVDALAAKQQKSAVSVDENNFNN